MITDYNSRKIRFFSSFLILMVMVLHSHYVEGEQYPASQYVQEFVGGGLCGVANYMFFLISGYLFFQGINDYRGLGNKMKKRVKSLLVPYVLWNIIFVLWYMALAMFPSLSERFVNSSIIDNLQSATWYEGLYTIFIKPVAFQLWFLRDLFVFVLFSPIIYWILTKISLWFPILLFISSFFVSWIGFLAMFVLGGYISVHNLNVDLLTASCKKCLPLFALLYLIGAIIYPMHFVEVKSFHALFFLCGIITLWCTYDIIHIDQIHWYEPLLGYGFFIYCSHMPFFNIIKKVNLTVLGNTQTSILLLYFINPLIAITCIVLVAKLFQALWPKGYLVLTGYRK